MREDDKSSGSSRNAQGPGKPDWWDVNSINLGCAVHSGRFHRRASRGRQGREFCCAMELDVVKRPDSSISLHTMSFTCRVDLPQRPRNRRIWPAIFSWFDM